MVDYITNTLQRILILSGAGWLPLLPSFKKAFPGLTPVTLTASIIYYPPAVKDLANWVGMRQVSSNVYRLPTCITDPEHFSCALLLYFVMLLQQYDVRMCQHVFPL